VPCISVRRFALLLIALTAAALPASASARTGACLPDGTGPTCHFWTAKVTDIADGDTIGVDIDGDGTHLERRVRFIDVQAMEQSVYSTKHPERRRGECHALEATARVEQLIKRSHWRVRLAAQNPASHAGTRSG
jgi:endonuclease YncB( thermonuclease family)